MKFDGLVERIDVNGKLMKRSSNSVKSISKYP